MAEHVEVISVFREKTMRPVKFKYASRVHVVSKILYSWMTREGSFPVHNFSVLTKDDERFGLSLNTYTMDWEMLSVGDTPVDEAVA